MQTERHIFFDKELWKNSICISSFIKVKSEMKTLILMLVFITTICIGCEQNVQPPDPVEIKPPLVPSYLGTYSIDSTYTSTLDTRGRTMGLKIYFPKNYTAAAPLIIAVHGGKGNANSFESLRYLGYTLASHGFVVVHGQYLHPDDLDIFINKPKDASNLIDNVLNGSITITGFGGTIDATKIGECGHSGGAFTGIALAGSKHLYQGNIVSNTDSRVKCVFVLSPNGTNSQWFYYINSPTDNSWSNITIPVFTAYGALEGNADNGRAQPYANMPAGNKYQAVLAGIDHDNWSGTRAGATPSPADSIAEQYGKSNAAAFFNYYLLNKGVKDSIGLYGQISGVTFSKK